MPWSVNRHEARKQQNSKQKAKIAQMDTSQSAIEIIVIGRSKYDNEGPRILKPSTFEAAWFDQLAGSGQAGKD